MPQSRVCETQCDRSGRFEGGPQGAIPGWPGDKRALVGGQLRDVIGEHLACTAALATLARDPPPQPSQLRSDIEGLLAVDAHALSGTGSILARADMERWRPVVLLRGEPLIERLDDSCLAPSDRGLEAHESRLTRADDVGERALKFVDERDAVSTQENHRETLAWRAARCCVGWCRWNQPASVTLNCVGPPRAALARSSLLRGGTPERQPRSAASNTHAARAWV